MNKLSSVDIISFIENNGYILLKDTHDNGGKLNLRDNDGYKYNCGFHIFKNSIKRGSGPAKFHINNKFTIENIANFLEKNFPKYKLLSGQEFKGIKEELTFIDDDGYLYSVSFDDIYDAKIRNGKVRAFDISNKHTLHNIELWIFKNEKPYSLINGQTYKGKDEKLLLKCNYCPPEEIPFKMSWNEIQRGNGCGICSNTQIGKYNSLEYLFPSVAKEWDYDKNYPILPSMVAPKTPSSYYWICPECGGSYKTRISTRTILGGGCSKCSESKGEKKIDNYLKEMNLLYESQYRISDCRDSLPLPFDFAVWINGCLHLIEYQGIQHFVMQEMFGGELGFEKNKRHDEIKKNYCKDKSIKFIEINYWDFNNIESILARELNLQN